MNGAQMSAAHNKNEQQAWIEHIEQVTAQKYVGKLARLLDGIVHDLHEAQLCLEGEPNVRMCQDRLRRTQALIQRLQNDVRGALQ